MKANSEYFDTIRDLYSCAGGGSLPVELSESLLLREAGVSSLMAITLVSRQLENTGQDPSDIEVEWLDLLETFGGMIQILRSIDTMADSATA